MNLLASRERTFDWVALDVAFGSSGDDSSSSRRPAQFGHKPTLAGGTFEPVATT